MAGSPRLKLRLKRLPPTRSRPRRRRITDATEGLGLDARDKAALAEMRPLTAGWNQPLTDAEIVRAVARGLTGECTGRRPRRT